MGHVFMDQQVKASSDTTGDELSASTESSHASSTSEFERG